MAKNDVIEVVTEFDDYLESSAKLEKMFLQADKAFLKKASIRTNDVKSVSLIEQHFGYKKEA